MKHMLKSEAGGKVQTSCGQTVKKAEATVWHQDVDCGMCILVMTKVLVRDEDIEW